MFNRITWSTLLTSFICFPLSVFCTIPVLAAERLTFFYPPFGEFELGVEDLEIFAKDGRVTKNFAFYAERVSPKELDDFRKLLNQNFRQSPAAINNFLKTNLGKRMLQEISLVIDSPSEISQPFLEAAIIEAAASSEGLTVLEVLEQYGGNSPEGETLRLNTQRVKEAVKEATTLFKDTERVFAALEQEGKMTATKNSAVDVSSLPDLSQAGSAQWQNAADEFNFSQRSFKSNLPDPNAPSISQLASDLQLQTQVESEETQPILEKPEAPEISNQPAESASSRKARLAEKSQNPIANLISVPFQNNTNFGVGELDRTQNILNIQPVIPIDLNDDWLLVTRTILPVIYQPVLTQTEYNHHFRSGDSQSSHFGLGDLNPQFFFVPKNDSKITLGIGPTFLLPTATNNSLGTRKWGIGPTAVVVLTDAPWVVGALINNIWSVAGDSDRPNVSQFLFQPFINYNLANGWYLVSGPIITANWNASSGNKWTIPIGGGIGKIFKIGHQSVNASLQGYWNVETPEGGADWTLRTQIQLLFPE